MNGLQSWQAEPGFACLFDAQKGGWRVFQKPQEILIATSLSQVVPLLEHVEEKVEKNGLHAAGMLSYEAAPAMDSALTTCSTQDFPYAWFGLYGESSISPLPALPDDENLFEVTWMPSVSSDEYYQAITQIKNWISTGDTYQVNYTYRLHASIERDPWICFRSLVNAQPTRFGAFMHIGNWLICSASPELFFRLDGDRIECRPMKGTIRRGLWSQDDKLQASRLRTSPKERAENLMIVDMARNDLGRIALPGSVTVPALFEVEKYPTLWQMISVVQARTQASFSKIFRSLFPAASITGAPKRRTMEIISCLEHSPRNIYTGTLGFYCPQRKAQFNVAIRTLLFDLQRKQCEYGVGSGIVWDSEPEKEWLECSTKTRVLSVPSPAFQLLETMKWTPLEGFYLLKLHLERLEQSADYFSFHIDLNQVLQKLDFFVKTLPPHPHKVRLRLDKDGNIELEASDLPAVDEKIKKAVLAANPIDPSNPLLYYKTTQRSIYERAKKAHPGFDDVILVNQDGQITESTIANVFVESDGILHTPPLACGLLPGVYRASLLQHKKAIEKVITISDLLKRQGVYLGNSVRGLYPVQVFTPDSGCSI